MGDRTEPGSDESLSHSCPELKRWHKALVFFILLVQVLYTYCLPLNWFQTQVPNGCLPATSPSPLLGLHQLELILELELELIPQTLKVGARIFPKGKLEYCFTKKIERMRWQKQQMPIHMWGWSWDSLVLQLALAQKPSLQQTQVCRWGLSTAQLRGWDRQNKWKGNRH